MTGASQPPLTTWLNVDIPSGISSLAAISCGGAGDCVAVGSSGANGVAIETTDGGSTWVQDTLPTQAPPLVGVSCAAAGECVASGTDSNQQDPYLYVQTAVDGAFTSVQVSRAASASSSPCPARRGAPTATRSV